MQPKQQLMQVQILRQRIDAEARRLEIYEAELERAGLAISQGRKAIKEHGTGQRINMITDSLGIMRRNLSSLKRQLTRIIDTINAIPDHRLALILELRYLSGCAWQEIAERSFCSLDHVYYLHRQALRAYAEAAKKINSP